MLKIKIDKVTVIRVTKSPFLVTLPCTAVDLAALNLVVVLNLGTTGMVAPVRIEQNFPPLQFRQYLSFPDKNHIGERRMPRRVQKHNR